MGIVETIALSMGVAWASGINLYAAIATLGVLGATGNMDLPPGMEIMAEPAVIAAAGFMYCVEFFADKFPGVDTGWDTLHSFIRIPAGAVLAATALGNVDPGWQIAAAIIGGGLAATSHGMKSGTRILINTSPEPFTNWAASVAEDVAVFGGLLAAIYYPAVFLFLLALFVLFAIWVMPKIWRGIKAVFARIRSLFGGTPAQAQGSAGGAASGETSGGVRGLFKPATLAEDPPIELGPPSS